ncbi:MAG: shikimate dehydrogenase [Jatrophihabitantaceae bacterium]
MPAEPARPPAPARLAGVLGTSVGRSLSPVLHQAAYAALGLTGWRYTAIECAEADLSRVLAEHPDAAGFSCTMPLKRAVLRVAATASPAAAAIGAGNTLLPAPAGWHADNTDWIGIADALAEQAVRPRRVTILGAGGTAQAALAAVSGAAEITVLVREPARAAELLATADRLGMPVRVGRLGEPAAADLLISTLPPGVADELAAGLAIGPDCTVLDAVYAGWPTALARTAEQAGAAVISGASMLLYQAARQVELMTGRAAPVAAMRAAMRAAVPGCGC